MSARTYNRIANASIATAVVSALLFNRIGEYQWVAGCFGIAAGLVSASIYLYNQFHLKNN